MQGSFTFLFHFQVLTAMSDRSWKVESVSMHCFTKGYGWLAFFEKICSINSNITIQDNCNHSSSSVESLLTFSQYTSTGIKKGKSEVSQFIV